MSDVLTSGGRAVTQPASRVSGYGNKAVQQPTRVAQAPAKNPAGAPPKGPPHLRIAKRELSQMYPGDPVMSKVVFREWKHLPSKIVRSTSYGGWTNSGTDVYLNRGLAGLNFNDMEKLALLRVIVQHESWHVKQFAKAGTSPSKYEEMMGYECQAYPETVKWIDGELKEPKWANNAALQSLRAVMKKHGDAFCKKINHTVQNVKPNQRERAYYDFLVDPVEQYLPKHAFGRLPDIYAGKI